VTGSEKVLYTARTRTTGGRRDGAARSSDGRHDVRYSSPGGAGIGTNPEQLLAAGWSACFEGAMEIAARKKKVVLPKLLAFNAEIDLILFEDAYALRARLTVNLPGLDREIARGLILEAHRTCPYSKAVRGNLDVTVDLF
jgi:Ohr subfamily peroxiredoxin